MIVLLLIQYEGFFTNHHIYILSIDPTLAYKWTVFKHPECFVNPNISTWLFDIIVIPIK